jgi:hypothetical protein
MEYCAPLGIPHSKFLGWSDEDRSKAISYMQWKKKFCQRCGTDPSEWIGPDGKTVEPPPYEPVTHVCYGCAALEEERVALSKEDSSSSKYHTFLQRYSGDESEWQMKK